MKKIFCLFVVICCLYNSSFCQSDCNVYLTASGEASCILTDYPRHLESGNCFLACQGSSITYTAAGTPAVNYEWIIGGALNYTIVSGGLLKIRINNQFKK